MALWLARLVGLCCLIMVLAPGGGGVRDATGAAPPVGTRLPGAVIVAFHPGASPVERVALLTRLHALPDGIIEPIGAMRLRVPLGEEQAIASALAKEPGVRYAELDSPARALEVPDDPRWSDQWNMRQIRAEGAWDQVRDVGGRVIAIIDSGIDLDHPDLVNVLWTNPGEIPNNGRDDDGNGKVDDVYGWHFGQACNYQSCWHFEDNRLQDDHGHGTHVAGIAGAEANNGVGVAGLAWGARLMTVKVLDEYASGSCFDVAAGVVYAAANGASVLNLSIACDLSSQALADAIAYARLQRGSLVVAAAGNDGDEVVYPASDPLTLAVGAVDSSDTRAYFCSQGPGLDVMAPGVEVLSTWPKVSGYFRKSGTSMAAPHVSGLAALVWAANPSLNTTQVTEVITTTVVDLGPPGWDKDYGYGRIDAHAAVLAALAAGPRTPIPSPSPMATRTPRPTATAAWTRTPTATATPTPTVSNTPLPSATPTPTWTPLPSATSTFTPSATASLTPAITPTPSVTETASATAVVTVTPTALLPSPTAPPARNTPAVAQIYLPLMIRN